MWSWAKHIKKVIRDKRESYEKEDDYFFSTLALMCLIFACDIYVAEENIIENAKNSIVEIQNGKQENLKDIEYLSEDVGMKKILIFLLAIMCCMCACNSANTKSDINSDLDLKSEIQDEFDSVNNVEREQGESKVDTIS